MIVVMNMNRIVEQNIGLRPHFSSIFLFFFAQAVSRALTLGIVN